MFSRVKNKLLELDPMFLRLEHSLKVAIICIISGAIALYFQKPQIYWLPLVATLLPDVIYGMQGKKAHCVYWVAAILIFLFVLIFMPLGQFKDISLVVIFFATLVGLSLPLFDLSIFPLGLYFAVFAVLTLMKPNDAYTAFNSAVSALLGALLAYVLYFALSFNLPYLSVRSNLRNSLKWLSCMFRHFDVDEETLHEWRMRAWKSTSAIAGTIDTLSVNDKRKKRTKKYYHTLWHIRRRLAFLHAQLDYAGEERLLAYRELKKLGVFLQTINIPYVNKGERFPELSTDSQTPVCCQLEHIFSLVNELYQLVRYSRGT